MVEPSRRWSSLSRRWSSLSRLTPRAGPRGAPRPRRPCPRRRRWTGTSSRRRRPRTRCRRACWRGRTSLPGRVPRAGWHRSRCRRRCPRLEQLAHPAHGVARADREARVDQRLVVQLRHEALVEVAQSVDQLAVARLGRDQRDLGGMLAEPAAGAHQRARRTEAGDEVRDRRAGRRGSRVPCPRSARARWRGCRTGRASKTNRRAGCGGVLLIARLTIACAACRAATTRRSSRSATCARPVSPSRATRRSIASRSAPRRRARDDLQPRPAQLADPASRWAAPSTSRTWCS